MKHSSCESLGARNRQCEKHWQQYGVLHVYFRSPETTVVPRTDTVRGRLFLYVTVDDLCLTVNGIARHGRIAESSRIARSEYR